MQADGNQEQIKNPDDELVAEETATGAVFYIIFELASAFGNVGLSLGSIKRPSAPTSFSRDLRANYGALLVMCVVMVAGRTRELPGHIDSALSLPTVTPDDILRDSTVMHEPANAASVDGAEPPPAGEAGSPVV